MALKSIATAEMFFVSFDVLEDTYEGSFLKSPNISCAQFVKQNRETQGKKPSFLKIDHQTIYLRLHSHKQNMTVQVLSLQGCSISLSYRHNLLGTEN